MSKNNDTNKDNENKNLKRIIDKIKECLIEVAFLLSAASVLIPFIVEKLKILIYTIRTLIFQTY